MPNRALLIVLIVAVRLLAPGAFAQDTSAGLLDPAAVFDASKAVTAEKYPNADDVLVEDHIRTRYRSDGTSTTIDDTFMKVLTEKGRRENETLSFHFNAAYSAIEVTRLEVYKPDGRVVPIDVEGQSRVMVDRSQMGSNIYDPNSKILRVGVPGVEVGDLVRYVFVRETTKARVPDTWSDYQVFEYTSPIRRLFYEVAGPEELPLRSIALKDEVEGTVTHTREAKEGLLHYRWEVRDVPRMYREPSMPPLHNVVQRLLVSTIPDWEAISRWYWRLCAQHFDTTPAMEAKVEELTRGADGRRDRIEAIFKFVSQEIRYMGITIEDEAPGYEPHDVSLTFENRYGVCRDKAALLVAMLRIDGIEAFPVIIHNGPKKDEEVPQPYFNHAVTAVLEPDGSYLLMDSTDENTKDLLPAYLSNKSYLVARPEGETLLTSPIVPAEENLVRIDTRARLSRAGDLSAESTLRFEGINDNAYRGFFARVTPEERRRFFEAVAKRVVPGAKLVEFRLEPGDMQDTSRQLEAFVKFEAKDTLIQGRGTTMPPLPLWGARVGMVNFILGETGLHERSYPLVTEFACGVRENLSLELGGAVGELLALPEFEPIAEPTLEWRRDLEVDGGRMVATSEFALKVVEFTPEEYLTLKRTLKDIEYQDRKRPVFARAQAEEEADAEVVESFVVYSVGDDPAEWVETRTVKKKVLAYSGVKSHSDLKVEYNPAWEEVALEMARVTNADGEVREIADNEINILDAAWVGAAPRYPAGKTLVASLPGVGVGSVIEYRIRREKKARPFFQASEYFRGYEPIAAKRVEIQASDRVRASWSLESDVAADEAERVWKAEGQPAVKRERQLPPWWSFNPSLFVSTGRWESYAAQVRAALESAAGGGAEARARGAEMAGGDVAEALLRIRDFVARNIRAAGPDVDEVPLSAVSPADRTLREGYGNTADRAVLLAAMLREAGFEARFVLASRQQAIVGLRDPRLDCPDPSLFPQVLVAVDLDGETIYLNDTDQYAALGATAHDGCHGLDLGTGETFIIHATEDKRDRREVEYHVAVGEDGAAEIARVERFFGEPYAQFRRRAVETTAEELRRYQLELAGSISQSAEIVEPLEQRHTAHPGEETLRVRAERYAVVDGPFMYLTLPDSFESLFRVLSDTRANPLYWSDAFRRAIRIRVSLPPSFREVELEPSHIRWAAPGGAGRIEIDSERVNGGEIVVTYRAELDSTVIDVAEYDRILDIGRRLSHPQSRTILLGRGGGN